MEEVTKKRSVKEVRDELVRLRCVVPSMVAGFGYVSKHAVIEVSAAEAAQPKMLRNFVPADDGAAAVIRRGGGLASKSVEELHRIAQSYGIHAGARTGKAMLIEMIEGAIRDQVRG